MNQRIAFAFFLLLIAATSIAAPPDKPFDSEALKRYVSIWVDGDVALVDALIDPAIVRHHPASIQPPQIAGIETYKAYVAEFRKMHPDLQLKVTDEVANGNIVAYRYEASALNPATNQRFTFSGIALSKFGANGKIVEEWVTWDTYDLMAQVGLVPPRKQP